MATSAESLSRQGTRRAADSSRSRSRSTPAVSASSKAKRPWSPAHTMPTSAPSERACRSVSSAQARALRRQPTSSGVIRRSRLITTVPFVVQSTTLRPSTAVLASSAGELLVSKPRGVRPSRSPARRLPSALPRRRASRRLAVSEMSVQPRSRSVVIVELARNSSITTQTMDGQRRASAGTNATSMFMVRTTLRYPPRMGRAAASTSRATYLRRGGAAGAGGTRARPPPQPTLATHHSPLFFPLWGHLEPLEFQDLPFDRPLRGQPLDTGSPEEAVHARHPGKGHTNVLGLVEGTTVADHQHIRTHAPPCLGNRQDSLDSFIKRECNACSDRPGRGQAHMGDEDVSASSSHRLGLVRIEDIRRGEEVDLMGHMNGFDLLVVAHAGGFEVGAESPVNQPDGGEVLHTREANLLQVIEEDGHQAERIGTVDARKHGRLRRDRQHLGPHLLHDRVGVAVGHQAGQRTAPRHPVAPGVVDDDEVGAARLGHLGRDSGARTAADDGLARSTLRTQAPQDLFSCECHCPYLLVPVSSLTGWINCAYGGYRSMPSSVSTACSENAGSLMFSVILITGISFRRLASMVLKHA